MYVNRFCFAHFFIAQNVYELSKNRKSLIIAVLWYLQVPKFGQICRNFGRLFDYLNLALRNRHVEKRRFLFFLFCFFFCFFCRFSSETNNIFDEFRSVLFNSNILLNIISCSNTSRPIHLKIGFEHTRIRTFI